MKYESVNMTYTPDGVYNTQEIAKRVEKAAYMAIIAENVNVNGMNK